MKNKYLMSFLLCNLLHASNDEVNNLLNLSLEELLTVQFSETSRKEQSLMDSTSATYILTSEQIIRSGATNLPEALRLIPGVHVGRVSGSQYAISIRSPNTLLANDVLVMIDGRELFNRLSNGTYWDSINTMLEDIDHIEVVRGPGGSLWGSNASNGIINIVTKKATDTLGTLVSVRAGTQQDHGMISGRIGFGNADNATRIYATAKDIDRSTLYTNGQASNDALHFQQTGFRNESILSDGSELTIHGDLYKSDSELAKSTPETVDISGGNIFGLYKPNDKIRIQAYGDYTSRKRTTTSSTYRNYDLDYQQIVLLDNHTIMFGAGGRYTMHDYSHSGNSFTIAVNPNERNDMLYRSFIQDEIHYDSFSIVPGVKYEYYLSTT